MVSNCFVRFAITFFCSRTKFVYPNSPEEHLCWRGINALIYSVSPSQYMELYHFLTITLVTNLKGILNNRSCSLKIIGIRVVSMLVRRCEKVFMRLFEENGVMASIRLISRQHEVSSSFILNTNIMWLGYLKASSNLFWYLKELNQNYIVIIYIQIMDESEQLQGSVDCNKKKSILKYQVSFSYNIPLLRILLHSFISCRTRSILETLYFL